MTKILERGRYWDKAWNPIVGCEKISPACKHCWALAYIQRFHNRLDSPYDNVLDYQGNWNGRLYLNQKKMDLPRKAKKSNVYSVCWLGDLFHSSVHLDWLEQVFDMMTSCPQHQYLVLTKRPHHMSRFLMAWYDSKVPDHIWIGTSVESQKYIGRANDLMTINANLWVSLEPLLGEVDLNEYLVDGHIKCVVVGGDSGSRSRPMKHQWVHQIKQQCQEYDIPFFFKSWGKSIPPGQEQYKFDGVSYLDVPWVRR